MSKSRNTLNRNGKSVCSPNRQRIRKTVKADSDPDIFNPSQTDKPERVDLCAVIPFLEERIAFNMPSDLKYLDSVLDYLNERMLRFGIMNPGDSEVLIALDEAIVNAVKHGNKCDSDKAVHIVAIFNHEGARFTVTDEGPGYIKEEVPDPRDPCRLLEPSGRGLLLINHIMDKVCHNQRGNQIEMFKRAAQNFKAQSEEQLDLNRGQQ